MQNQPDSTANIVASISAVIAFASLVVSGISFWFARRSAIAAEKSATAAEETIATNISIAKRQGIIELHSAWNDIEPVDVTNPIPYKVAKAVNTLDLTASLWNHEVIEKEILYQSYWGIFRALYKEIESISTPIPNWGKTGSDLLSREIRKAYLEMEQEDTRRVPNTTIR